MKLTENRCDTHLKEPLGKIIKTGRITKKTQILEPPSCVTLSYFTCLPLFGIYENK